MQKMCFILTLGLLLFGCMQRTSYVSFGPYTFDFPDNYFLEYRQGVDSRVGVIKNENVEVHFDYGHYTNKLPIPREEYISKRHWMIDLEYLLRKPGVIYDDNNAPEVNVLETKDSIRSLIDSLLVDFGVFLAICEFEGKISELRIEIPEESVINEFQIDTINGHYRKIVMAKDPEVGVTGIYLTKLGDNKSVMGNMALGMSTTGITFEEQNELVKTFKNVRVNDK